MSISFSGAASIAGIGATEFSKESGRSELQLSCEATLAALADAGLAPADVDGLVTFTMDSSSEIAFAISVARAALVDVPDLSIVAETQLVDLTGPNAGAWLADRVHPGEYGGCYVPRFIANDPAKGL